MKQASQSDTPRSETVVRRVVKPVSQLACDCLPALPRCRTPACTTQPVAQPFDVDFTPVFCSSVHGVRARRLSQGGSSSAAPAGHHNTIWVPHRCELPSCTTDEDAALSRCGKCHVVLYCSREHQAADWARHKVECGHLASFRLTARVYKLSEERSVHPIGCATLPDPPAGTKPACGICGRTKPLMRTRCCDNWVCDRDHEYQVLVSGRMF